MSRTSGTLIASCLALNMACQLPTEPRIEEVEPWSIEVTGVVVEETASAETVPVAGVPYYLNWPSTGGGGFCLGIICFSGWDPGRMRVGFTDEEGRYVVEVGQELCSVAMVSAQRFIQTPPLEADSMRTTDHPRAVPPENCDGRTREVPGPKLVLGPAYCFQSCRAPSPEGTP